SIRRSGKTGATEARTEGMLVEADRSRASPRLSGAREQDPDSRLPVSLLIDWQAGRRALQNLTQDLVDFGTDQHAVFDFGEALFLAGNLIDGFGSDRGGVFQWHY